MRLPFTWTLAVGLAVLAGCLSYEEELTLRRDGSGLVKVHYFLREDMAKRMDEAAKQLAANPRLAMFGGVGPMFSEAGVKKALGDAKGLTLKSVREESKDGVRHIWLEADFNHLRSLGNAFIFRAGSVEWRPLSGGRMEYTRELGELGGMGRSVYMNPALPPMMEAVKDARIEFTVHFPGKVMESNGTECPASDTLCWKSGIADLKDISIMTAVIAPPASWWPIILSSVVVVLLLLILIRASGRGKAK